MITAVVVVNDDGFHIQKDLDLAHKDRAIPIVLEYLAEGGANVILRLVPFARASHISCPPSLQNKLLRLRKDKDFITGVREQQQRIARSIAPLFDPENLVESQLVTVDHDFLVATNAELLHLQSEVLRPEQRAGDRVAETENHAVLMTDMTPIGVEVCIELKPKWLVQSPDAPAEAKRCRTCALRAQRLRLSATDHAKAIETSYCPLALVSDDQEGRLVAARAILKANEIFWMVNGEDDLLKVMTTSMQPLLAKIKHYQEMFDRTGILAVQEGDDPSADYLLCMTLRDCTLFVKAPKNLKAGPIQTRLADLDAKLPHPDKIRKWRDTERALIEEGWYENIEQDAVLEHICLLADSDN